MLCGCMLFLLRLKAWWSWPEEQNWVPSRESSSGGGTRSTFNALLILAEEKRTFLLAVLDITEDIHFDHQRNASSTLEDLDNNNNLNLNILYLIRVVEKNFPVLWYYFLCVCSISLIQNHPIKNHFSSSPKLQLIIFIPKHQIQT